MRSKRIPLGWLEVGGSVGGWGGVREMMGLKLNRPSLTIMFWGFNTYVCDDALLRFIVVRLLAVFCEFPRGGII